jgi:hypothetical protein
MKRKYYVVEHIDYLAKQSGYPSSEQDERTFRRTEFQTKKEAKTYIKQYLREDPDYTAMWLAKISLHTITEKVEVQPFFRKIRNGTEPFTFAPIRINHEPLPFPSGGFENLEQDDRCICTTDEAGVIVIDNVLCPIHGWTAGAYAEDAATNEGMPQAPDQPVYKDHLDYLIKNPHLQTGCVSGETT